MPSTATLTPTKVGPNGTGKIADLVAGLAAATSGGDAFSVKGNEVLIVSNGDGSPHTVTVKAVANNFGHVETANDIVQAVAAGKITVIGPLEPAKYADANGLAQITWSALTSMKVGIRTFATTS